MPNWCSTKFVFTGNAQDITDIYNKITEYTSSSIGKSDFGNCWLGNVLIGFGLGDRIDSEADRLCCRGSITDIGEVEDCHNNFSFEFWTDTAWYPMVRMWYEIIAKHYDNRISVYWIAEESGNQLYLTNDIDWFSSDHYHVEWYIEESGDFEGDYFNRADEAANHINSLITNDNLNSSFITENDINDADVNGRNLYLNGEGWWISCTILKRANDNDVD